MITFGNMALIKEESFSSLPSSLKALALNYLTFQAY
jgi:hypothetical protein